MSVDETCTFEQEIWRLIASSRSARLLAEKGKRQAGRELLCAGFRRAQWLAARGVPRGLDLVGLWRAAILEYR